MLKIIFLLDFKITEILSLIMFRIPFLRKIFWKQQYNKISTIFNDNYIFMNLGYAHLNDNKIEQIKNINYLSEKLYSHVIDKINIDNNKVLEIGCGRGGGSAYIMKKYKPKSLTSIDISYKAIEMCIKIHKKYNIKFLQADAMSLPFKTGTFDTVVNIESSHCYPSRKKFIKEVFRILCPGGFFIYADLISFFGDNLSLNNVKNIIYNSGFTILKEKDITANIIKSRDILTESGIFEKAIYNCLKEEYKKYFSIIMPSIKNGYYLKDTITYNMLKSGYITYWTWILKKEDN